MNIATVLAITLLIIGLLTAFNGAWLVFSSLFPKFIRHSQTACASPLKSLFAGIAAGLVPFVIAVQLLGNAVGGIIGWPVILAVSALALAGTATIAQRIGNGMPSQNDRQEPWRRNLRGGVVLSISYLLPFVGWLWIPISLTLGSGIAIRALLAIRKERKIARSQEEEEEDEEDEPEREAADDSSRLREEVVS